MRSETTAKGFIGHIILWWVLCALSVGVCSAQVDASASAERLPSTGDEIVAIQLKELNSIEFEGCRFTSPEQLLGVLQSRESELSLTRRLGLYYYENLKKNPASPANVLNTLADIQEDLVDELRYFDEELVRLDSSSPLGVPESEWFFETLKLTGVLSTRSQPTDTSSRSEITENERSVLDTIVYIGLDKVDPQVLRWVKEEMTLKIGDPFSEDAFEENMVLIL